MSGKPRRTLAWARSRCRTWLRCLTLRTYTIETRPAESPRWIHSVAFDTSEGLVWEDTRRDYMFVCLWLCFTSLLCPAMFNCTPSTHDCYMNSL